MRIDQDELFESHDKPNDRDLGLQKSKLFANACSGATTKASKDKWWKLVALFLPSFRTELGWVGEERWIIVVAHRLSGDNGALGDWNIDKQVILLCFSEKLTINRSVMSCRFILDPFEVSDFLQVIKGNIFLTLDKLLDLAS